MSGRFLSGALAATFALATGAWAAELRASETLQLSARFGVTDTVVSCPPGSPGNATCFRFSGEAVMRGLGRVTESYTRMVEDGQPDCVRTLPKATIEVEGKGDIAATISIAECVGFPPAQLAYALDVDGGSGAYTGASGHVQVVSDVSTGNTHADTWSGTLIVPGLEFDLTPPTLEGAISRTVRVPQRARRVRLRYSVKASDAVDGRVPVTCVPRSGAFFRLGRTRVSCVATDSSANTSKAHFTITVKQRPFHNG